MTLQKASRRITKILLNKPYVSWLISIFLTCCVNLLIQDWPRIVYKNLFSFIPSSAISLLGFVLAALAIMTSISDRGLLKEANTKFFQLFVQETIKTIYILAIVALYLTLLDPLKDSKVIFSISNFNISMSRLYYAISMLLIIQATIQVYKSIYSTQQLAILSVKKPEKTAL